MEQIDLILADARKIDVDEFCGRKGDKQYLLTEEMLTRLLIKLDRIESEGRDEIRSARREAVRTVQGLLDRLEMNATSGARREQNTSVDEGRQDQTTQSHSTQEQSTDKNGGKSGGDGNPSDEKTAQEGGHSGSVKEMVLGSEVAC